MPTNTTQNTPEDTISFASIVEAKRHLDENDRAYDKLAAPSYSDCTIPEPTEQLNALAKKHRKIIEFIRTATPKTLEDAEAKLRLVLDIQSEVDVVDEMRLQVDAIISECLPILKGGGSPLPLRDPNDPAVAAGIKSMAQSARYNTLLCPDGEDPSEEEQEALDNADYAFERAVPKSIAGLFKKIDYLYRDFLIDQAAGRGPDRFIFNHIMTCHAALSAALATDANLPATSTPHTTQCIRMPDDSMEPEFDEGDFLILDTEHCTQVGDTVVYSLKSAPDIPVVRNLTGLCKEQIIVNTHAPNSAIPINRNDLAYICPVMSYGELLDIQSVRSCAHELPSIAAE